MRTGLTKREKTTAIYFDEYGSMIVQISPERCEDFASDGVSISV